MQVNNERNEQLTHRIEKDISRVLKSWAASDGDDDSHLQYLHLFYHAHREAAAQDGTAKRAATNAKLLELIQLLPEISQTMLSSRFIENMKLYAVANQLNVSTDTVSRRQKTALSELAEIIYTAEYDFRLQHIHAQELRLPPAQNKTLFGIEEKVQLVVEKLTDPAGPKITSVTGMGGIGKTALVERIARTLIRQLQFSQTLWYRAEYNILVGTTPSLMFEDFILAIASELAQDPIELSSFQNCLLLVKEALAEQNMLIVIDNIEDDEVMGYLVAQISNLIGRSRFLLTSRARITNNVAAFVVPVDELPRRHAYAMIQHLLEQTGQAKEITIKDEDAAKIFAVTGGNPLALELIVGQLDMVPLKTLLQGFQEGQAGPIQKMFDRIYQRSWSLLTAPAKSLLKAMATISDSAEPDYFLAVANLTENEFWPAVYELRSRSLIEIRGTLDEKEFGIHRLTAVFLKTKLAIESN